MASLDTQPEQKSKTVPIIIVVLAVLIGGGFYGYMNKNDGEPEAPSEITQADAEEATESDAADEEVMVADAEQNQAEDALEPAAGGQDAEAFEVKPGNPVIAKLNGKELTRVDFLRFVQQLPPQLRQQPLEQLYPMAQEQLINSQLITQKTEAVDLRKNEEVKKQVEEARKAIERTVFMQQEIEKRLTDDRLKQGYDLYVENFPKDIKERKAKHILVEGEEEAKGLIDQLKNGADFSELAKANSKDQGSAVNGGALNFFTANEVVPEFSKAAFSAELGSLISGPVKSQFGYHVIKVEEERTRPPVSFEEAKPSIEGQLRDAVLEEVLREWRAESKVEKFDINGNPIAPAAGE
jgi:peptidyl-prolyl cis-trans isomerase C